MQRILAVVLVLAGLGTGLAWWLFADTDVPDPPSVEHALVPEETQATVKEPPAPSDAAVQASGPEPLPRTPGSIPLADLIEPGQDGPLPRIGPDGRKPWHAYAMPFDATDDRPRIAIILIDLGLMTATSEAAIERMPPAVTLAFSPYMGDQSRLVAAALENGHEVLVSIPMEPSDDNEDPGPHGLMTANSAAENAVRFKWMLSRLTGYVGVVSQMGSRFTTSVNALRPILEETRNRGLLFVDSRTNRESAAGRLAGIMHVPIAIGDRRVDEELEPSAIDSRLRDLEVIARTKGSAVGIGAVSATLLDRLSSWIQDLEVRGFILAPITAVANKRQAR